MARGTTTRNLLIWWVLLFLLYIVLISPVTALELEVGVGAALLGAAGAEAVRRAEKPHRGGSVRLASAFAALPLALLRETGQLAVATAAVLRGQRRCGRVVTVRLRPDVDPGWAAALMSATPGSCVLDVTAPGGPGEGHLLTVHVLTDTASGLEQALDGTRVS